MHRTLAAFLLVAAASLFAQATDADPTPQPQFEAFKAMVGEWGVLGTDDKPVPDMTFEYELSAGGSVVVEKQFVGTPKEMMTMYHLDGDTLMLTHYCSAGNQPRMRARSGDETQVVEFDFLDGSNMDPAKDMHMHSARVAFEGKDRVSFTWQISQPGQEMTEGTYTLVRAAPAAAPTTQPTATTTSADSGLLLDAKGYDQYGAGAHQGETVDVAVALANPKAHAGKPIRLSGDIVNVCLKKGCWMRVGTEEENVHVRFVDYGFFVPVDTAGGVGAVLEGTLSVEEQSVEELRHYLEDAGKHEEAAKITQPETVVSFMATGVALEK